MMWFEIGNSQLTVKELRKSAVDKSIIFKKMGVILHLVHLVASSRYTMPVLSMVLLIMMVDHHRDDIGH